LSETRSQKFGKSESPGLILGLFQSAPGASFIQFDERVSQKVPSAVADFPHSNFDRDPRSRLATVKRTGAIALVVQV
jgi:hypothetical protein